MIDQTIQRRVLQVISDLAVRTDPSLASEEILIESLFPSSLDKVTFTMALEDEFNLDVPEEELADLGSLAEVIGFIEKKLATS